MKKLPNLKKLSKTLILSTLIIVSVCIASCEREVMFADDVLEQSHEEVLLDFKYSAETTTSNNYLDPTKGMNKLNSIPIADRRKFHLTISKSGEVESFTEVLEPSQVFVQDEGKKSSNLEVKYEHYKDGVLKLYNKDRELLGEVNVPALQQEYGDLYSKLSSEEYSSNNVLLELMTNAMDSSDQESEKSMAAGRSANMNLISDEYQDHEDYNVVRNPVEMDGKSLTNELIIHKPSNSLQYVSLYEDNTTIYRATFGYEQADGSDQLVSLIEESLVDMDSDNPYKEISTTNYDEFSINLNL